MLRLSVKTQHPQPRHISKAAQMLRAGALAIYPTDTTYGLGCDIYFKRSIDRIYQLKRLEKSHRLSFICSDLSQVATYAVLEDRNYRILRHHVPGEYTFILPATREVPKILQTKTRTVGIRVPDSPTCLALIREIGHPIITTTVSLGNAGDDGHLNDPDDIVQAFGRTVDVFLDGGPLYREPSSIIDLTGTQPEIIRRGSGDLSWLGG